MNVALNSVPRGVIHPETVNDFSLQPPYSADQIGELLERPIFLQTLATEVGSLLFPGPAKPLRLRDLPGEEMSRKNGVPVVKHQGDWYNANPTDHERIKCGWYRLRIAVGEPKPGERIASTVEAVWALGLFSLVTGRPFLVDDQCLHTASRRGAVARFFNNPSINQMTQERTTEYDATMDIVVEYEGGLVRVGFRKPNPFNHLAIIEGPL